MAQRSHRKQAPSPQEPPAAPVTAYPCDYTFVFQPDDPFLGLPSGASPIQCARVIAPALGRTGVIRICTIDGKIRDAYHYDLSAGERVTLRTERGVAIPARRLAAAAKAIGLAIVPMPNPGATYQLSLQKSQKTSYVAAGNAGKTQRLKRVDPPGSGDGKTGSAGQDEPAARFAADARQETTGSTRPVQQNRQGKKLIGAYVDIPDVEKFKAILKARGTNTQEFFAQVVANEIAAASGPQGLERLIDAQLDRFRATLLPTLKK